MPNEYPEHEKLKALGGANETIGDFLQWLDQHGYTVCERYEGERGQGYHQGELIPANKSIDQ